MDRELRLRLLLGLNLIALCLCTVAFFVEHWGKGDPPILFKDTPIAKDSIKHLDYDKFTSVGVFRSCVFKSCIANVADGDSVWNTIASLGILALGCHTLSTSLTAYQLFSKDKKVKYAQLLSHCVGVVLFTMVIGLYCWTTSGITMDIGFYLAIIADSFSLGIFVYTCTTFCKVNNRVEILT